MNTSGDTATLMKQIEDLEAKNRLQEKEIQRLKAENKRWAKLAGTEALTGLPNKISFMRAFVPQTLQKAARDQQSAGFILLSADNLGDVNQAYGREAGDQIIRGLGELLKSLLNESDRIGHLDGTHFAVILYPTDLDAARGRANMIRARVRAHGFPCADTMAQVTVSLGAVSITPSKGTDFRDLGETLFQRLNEALYAAKKAEGNRVEVIQEKDLFGKDAS